MDSVTQRTKRNGGAALIAAAPLVLLLTGAALLRGLHVSRAPNATASGPAVGARHVPPPSSVEISALNEARLQADQSEAYQAAQNEVRAFLLHPDARLSARFPAHLTSRNVTIEKRSPTRFRVRSIVEWQQESGDGPQKTQTVQSRRFEADLLHGPADDKWRLIDTEFLDAPR